MQSAILPYGRSHIHYLYTGRGPECIVALHGYGASAASFGFLENPIGDSYRMVAVDLPFHGQTRWREGRAFTPEDLSAIIDAILHTPGTAITRYIVLGYSMGGKLALSLTRFAAGKIAKLVLLAPEGLKANFWQWLTTQTRAGNRLFHFTMQHPGWFFRLLHAAGRLGLLHRPVVRFTLHYMRNGRARSHLFNRWTCLRACTPDITKITALIQQHRVPVRMLFGRFDAIIPATGSRRFRRLTGKYCQLYTVEAGHRLLDRKHTGMIIRLLAT